MIAIIFSFVKDQESGNLLRVQISSINVTYGNRLAKEVNSETYLV